MKKIILTMASAMACMSMVAAPGVDKKNALKTPVSRADLVSQTEMLMSALSSDGFGLDAEDYELLMGQDLDMLDDMAGSITMPSCASETPSLNSLRPTTPTHPPIGPGPIKLNAVGGTGSGSFDQVGTARPDVVPSLNSLRPTDPTYPPIGPGPKVRVNGCSGSGDFSGDSSFEDMVKGNTRPDVVPSLNGMRPTLPFDPPIGPGPIKLNAVGGTGSGSFDQVGTARPDVVPSLNGSRPTNPYDPRPIGPGPKVQVNGCSGSGDFSGDSNFEDMVKGNTRPDVVPSLNGSRPTRPIGPGPIDF